MTNQNGTTPPNGAILPNVPAVVPPTSASTPPSEGKGKSGEGKVTIDLKEYRDLQRAKARTLSFDKRSSFSRNKTASPRTNDGTPPGQDDTRVTEAEAGRIQAEQRALAAEVKAGITEILGREEFKNLPESTKALIRSNPGMLSDADNVEEALLDIEDKCREYAGLEPISTPSSQTVAPQGDPAGHETPPAPGTPPAPTDAIGLEDVSKLPPQERSRAVLRNAIRKSKGVK